jgi:signal transduction histidine kinase
MQSWLKTYVEKEDQIITMICTRYWNPKKRLEGASIVKADLLIRAYFRIFMLSFLFFIKTLISMATDTSSYRFLSLLAPFSTLLAIYIFCRTDSERKTGYFALGIVYATICVSVSTFGNFETFAARSSIFIVFGGLVLGNEGVLFTFIANTLLGFAFLQANQNEPNLGILWASFHSRTFAECCLSLIGILKFTETFGRLEQADKHKTEFLCRMSHELRTPLSGIIGSIEILKFAPLTDQNMRLINIAQECSKNLLQVINDILDFSKVLFY